MEKLRKAYDELEVLVQKRTTELMTANRALMAEIKERELAEEALQREEEYFRSLIENSYDIIVVLDKEGKISYESPSVERVLGYERGERIGKSPFEFTHKDDVHKVRQAFAETLQRPGTTVTTEIRYKHGDGVWRMLAVRGVNLLSMPSVQGVVLNISDITEQKKMEEHLDNMAHYDVLTGLPNRRLFYDRLAQTLTHSKRSGERFTVLFVDLDHFKMINDSLGHETGDLLLRHTAMRFDWCLREEDTIARNGGDEFLIILPGVGSAAHAANVAQKLIDVVKEPFNLNGYDAFIGATVGIALFPADGSDPETLVKNADMAMYRAKEEGRGNYRFHTGEMDEKVIRRMTLENELHRALDQEEFVLYYQPKVAAVSGNLVGVEALLRWNREGRGMVSPQDFIPVAEDSGLIIPIGRWVLRTACIQGRKWKQAGKGFVPIAVNLSARQFNQPDLVEMIAGILSETGLEPEGLELEITESVSMQDPESTAGKLKALSNLGIRISIDDFGTGYSSLAYLKQFSINTLKIDRSFIRNIIEDNDDMAITKAVIAMAQSLKLNVVAEGVETMEQCDCLRSLNCRELQGFLFSIPLPADTLESLLNLESWTPAERVGTGDEACSLVTV